MTQIIQALTNLMYLFYDIPEDQKNAVIMQHCIQKMTFFSLLISMCKLIIDNNILLTLLRTNGQERGQN